MRDSGQTVTAIGDMFGVAAGTVQSDPLRGRKDAGAAGWGPPAELLLDWLRELPLHVAGMPRSESLAYAGAAMGHPVG